MSVLLVAQLASTLPPVGLTWFVQLVPHPLFGEASALALGDFTRYAEARSRRITVLVLPLMLVELFSAGAWLVAPPAARTSACTRASWRSN